MSVPVPPRRGLSDAVPALLAAATFGVAAPFGKRAFEGVAPWFAAGWQYACAGVALLAWTTLRRRPPAAAPTSGRDRAALALATALGAVLAPFALMQGLARLPAYEASLLLNLEIVLTPTIAVIAFRERLAASRWVGAGLVLAGAVACAAAERGGGADGRGHDAGGALWIAAACLGWALDSNLMRLLVHRDPLAVARDKGLLGGGAALAIAAATAGVPRPDGADALLVLVGGAALGVVSYGISVALYLASLRRLPTATTGALFGVAPFVGVLVAWGVLGERPGPWFAIAAATAAVGVVLLARPGAPADPRRTPSAPAGSA